MRVKHGKPHEYSANPPAIRPAPRLLTFAKPPPPPSACLLCSHAYALLPTAEPPPIPAPQD